MLILGIETSCDETAAALYDSHQGLIAHAVHSQLDIHQAYGGVVPELASRDHIQKLLPLIERLLQDKQLSYEDLSGIAYTQGPGLIGALMVGASLAKSLAYALQIPAIGINHLEAHILAVMLEEQKPTFPFLALLVSGGHTLLAQVKGIGNYEVLGETLDDAVGECFDKIAKILGLPYPGGAALAVLAEQGEAQRFNLPRPLLAPQSLDFSFSGLKTSARMLWDSIDKTQQNKCNLARAFQDAVVETLIIKCKRAMLQTKLRSLVVVGGVAANRSLRTSLQALVALHQGQVYFPRIEFCTDNAAMVAYTGHCYQMKGYNEDLAIELKTRWPLSELNRSHL